MPVLLTSCFPTGAEVFSTVRSMINDADLVATNTITAAGRVSSVTTITTGSPHLLQINNYVQVASVSDTTFNGSFVVVAIPTPTTFQYVQTGQPDATSTNGIVQMLIQGDVFTDNVLLPLANKAYRKVQARLFENGAPSQTAEALITLPAGTTMLLDTTDPQLPVDFVAPRIIREKITGQTYYNNPPMRRVNVLPSVAQAAYLGLYAWYEDGLWFIGAFNDIDIALRYFVAFPDLSGAEGAFTIRGCQDVICDWTAFLAAASRGSQQAGTFASIFEQDMKEFLNMTGHSRQYLVGRRQPNNRGRHGWRGSGQGQGTV